MKRPNSVTVVAWLLIVMMMIFIPSLFWVQHATSMNTRLATLMARDPVSPRDQLIIGFIGSIIDAIAGVLMLRGQVLGSTLYTAVGALLLIYGFVTTPVEAAMVGSVLVFLVFMFLLYRPAANVWFHRATA